MKHNRSTGALAIGFLLLSIWSASPALATVKQTYIVPWTPTQ